MTNNKLSRLSFTVVGTNSWLPIIYSNKHLVPRLSQPWLKLSLLLLKTLIKRPASLHRHSSSHLILSHSPWLMKSFSPRSSQRRTKLSKNNQMLLRFKMMLISFSKEM